jgi:homoserine acetyltransferase
LRKEIVGPGALDANRVLGIDFLGGSGATTGPAINQVDFPSVSTFDQAALLHNGTKIGIEKLHAIVGT